MGGNALSVYTRRYEAGEVVKVLLQKVEAP